MQFARYDRIVAHYPAMWPLLVPGYVPILNGMLDVVRAWNERPRQLLDLGCGPASATVAVAAACDPEGSVTLVDGAADMLLAARKLLGAQVSEGIVGDFTEPTTAKRAFVPNRYDLALCSFALHHIDDAQKREVIDGMAKSIRHGGLLLLADEVVADRPAGWDVVALIRSRLIDEHVSSGRIPKEFLNLETSLPSADALPFLPGRIDDFTSALARAGFAVSCPIVVLGCALLVGVKST